MNSSKTVDIRRPAMVAQLVEELGRLEVAMIWRLHALQELLPDHHDLRAEAVRLERALLER